MSKKIISISPKKVEYKKRGPHYYMIGDQIIHVKKGQMVNQLTKEELESAFRTHSEFNVSITKEEFEDALRQTIFDLNIFKYCI